MKDQYYNSGIKGKKVETKKCNKKINKKWQYLLSDDAIACRQNKKKKKRKRNQP